MVNLTENAKRVLAARYQKKDENGEVVETAEELFDRVSDEIASAELGFNVGYEKQMDNYVKYHEKFFDMMDRLDFLPNSPTLMNAGKGNGLQLAACYVLPLGDSIQEIFETNRRAALIHQSGGGTGFSLSRLRPEGDVVRSTGGMASGPISFLEALSATTEAVKQGGTRRGANMAVLRVDHPDVMKFINCKRSLNTENMKVWRNVAGTEYSADVKRALLENQINNFNISIGITNEFMKALESGDSYKLVNPRNGEVVDELSAVYVWGEIVDCAWESGDPGLVFLDRMNDGGSNPTPKFGPIESTNPCGEVPLYPNEACNLGSINLINFVKDGEIDWNRLGKIVFTAVRFLDDVVDVNPYPDELVREMATSNRRIGLGVMGWADLLIKLGIRYDSEEAVNLGYKVMEFINSSAHLASHELAVERGNFKNWEDSIFCDRKRSQFIDMRNCAVTTIAPTGTISIIAGCSSGIEPLFAVEFDRAGSLDGGLVVEFHDFGGVGNDVVRTAHDIDPEWHVSMQAAFQANVDNAVSKTINLRHDAGVWDVDKAYRLAWELGCKGITVYRDGSKVGVLHVAEPKKLEYEIGGGIPRFELVGSAAYTDFGEGCPECGGELAFEEGCNKCYECGYSACSV